MRRWYQWPPMTLHPRHNQTARASIDINKAVCEAAGKHGLTFAELVNILAAVLASWSRSVVKEERNDREDTSGDPNRG